MANNSESFNSESFSARPWARFLIYNRVYDIDCLLCPVVARGK